METYRWFWSLLAIATLVWYSTITLFVAYKGVFDIQHMLKKLSGGDFNPDAPEAPVTGNEQ
ncbi:hypothetical protein [Schlesneria sp. T3-172]|uniref:hypothetical protein n=1 Tax=Schlesneria sphaerica TaxID=3373610 RepID=UPI0037C57F7E